MKALLMLIFGALLQGGCAPQPTFTSVEAEAFAQTIADSAVQLVDVRTAEEYAEGHIPGAVNMDVMAEGFGEQIKALDKQRPVALYCRSGRRSKRAAEQVAKAGYQVVELNGGILSWKGALEQ